MASADPNRPLPLVMRRGRARARISYQNRGGTALVAHAAPSLRAGLPVERLSLRGIVPPGQSGEIAVRLHIDPRTPPGRYPAALQMGDAQVPVEILVPEERLVDLQPNSIAAHVAPGQELAHKIVVENRGNVPIAVHDPDAVALQPAEALHDLLRRALKETNTDDPDEFQRSLVARGREMIQADRGRLVLARIDEGAQEIPPGGSALVTLRYRVPPRLDRGTEYLMHFHLAGVPVQVRLHYPRSNGGNGGEPPATP